MKTYHWDQVEHERLSDGIGRRVINADRLTVARIYLAKGKVVPRHSHENEQVSYLLEGRLRFVFDDRELTVAPGAVMQIASHEPHRVEALEDSVALDIFQPVRADWLSGDDSYLRNPEGQS